MSFPTTVPLLDTFDRADGVLGPNWISPGGSPLAISGGMAAGQIAGASTSFWAVPAGTPLSVFTTLPVVAGSMLVYLSPGGALAKFVRTSMNAAAATVTLTDNSSGAQTTTLASVANGDGIGLTYVPTTATIASWYYDSTGANFTAGTWNQLNSQVAPLALTGWMLGLSTTGTTSRMKPFGGEGFPTATGLPHLVGPRAF